MTIAARITPHLEDRPLLKYRIGLAWGVYSEGVRKQPSSGWPLRDPSMRLLYDDICAAENRLGIGVPYQGSYPGS